MSTPINGIWLNTETNAVLRVNSPYWKEEVAKSQWVKVTDEVNATLLSIRETIAEKALSPNADSVSWQ